MIQFTSPQLGRHTRSWRTPSPVEVLIRDVVVRLNCCNPVGFWKWSKLQPKIFATRLLSQPDRVRKDPDRVVGGKGVVNDLDRDGISPNPSIAFEPKLGLDHRCGC